VFSERRYGGRPLIYQGKISGMGRRVHHACSPRFFKIGSADPLRRRAACNGSRQGEPVFRPDAYGLCASPISFFSLIDACSFEQLHGPWPGSIVTMVIPGVLRIFGKTGCSMRCLEQVDTGIATDPVALIAAWVANTSCMSKSSRYRFLTRTRIRGLRGIAGAFQLSWARPNWSSDAR